MQPHTNRRTFLKTSAATSGIMGLGSLQALAELSPATEAEVVITPQLVQLRPEIKPLVKLIDETPREKMIEVLIEQLRSGVPYRQLLAAAFLTAIGRGGHHSVYLIHSAHQMSLDVRPEERLLPLFWGVDVIKEHLGRQKMKRVAPLRGQLPTPEQAATRFDHAMQNWDQDGAERSIISLARTAGGHQAMERLWPYVARDWSFIGHLAISMVNCWRTLQTIGWQHAEQVLSYVIRDLHRWGEDKAEGQPYWINKERVERGFSSLPYGWSGSECDRAATLELLNVIRVGNWQAACDWSYEQLVAGKVRAGTIWDAVHLAAAEFMVRFRLGGRRISNRALHSNTSANALHYAFRTCSDSKTRLLILLQAVAWVTGFTENETSREMMRDIAITNLPTAELPKSEEEAVEAIFAELPPRPFLEEIEDRSAQDRASQLAFAFGRKYSTHQLYLSSARRLLCLKATINAHDIKYPTAVFEDLDHVSRQWHPHLLAASVHFLHGPASEDNPVLQRARLAAG